MMNFNDAVNNMLNGKRMMRSNWQGYYVAIMPGQSYIWQVGSTNTKIDPNVNAYTASIEDIFATDWMVKL